MINFRSVFSFDASTASSKKQFDLINRLEDFSENEDGIATVWAMFWLILCFSISGLAIDVTNAWKVHEMLQSTADSAALAGAYELQAHDTEDLIEANVKDLAVTYAELNMNTLRFGDVLLPEDVQLGYWYSATQSGDWYSDVPRFSPMSVGDLRGPANTVYVTTRQSGTAATTAVGTFFLRFVGFDRFTVATQSVASIFISRCAYDGLFAAGQLNLTMGQSFYDEFCIHGEEGIFAAQGNFVSDNSIVSAPSYDLCGQNETKCSEDTDANIGFQESFIEQTLFPEVYDETDTSTQVGGPQTAGNIWMSENVDGYIDSLSGRDGTFKFSPSYVTHDASAIVPISLTGSNTINDVLKEMGYENGFEKGKTYEITCRGGKDVNLAPADDETWDTISQVVIVGIDCDFVFAPSIQYYDIVIATDSTSRSSFSSPEGITLGYYDGCDDYSNLPSSLTGTGNYYGGAVTLLTQGSVHFASKFHSYDMEIIAANDVHLAGRPIKDTGGNTVEVVGDDLEPTGINVHVGTTITTGGDIHVSRSHEFNGCLGRVSSNLFDPNKSWRLVW